MDSVTRRRFLIGSGVTAGVALAGGATAVGLSDVLDRAKSDPKPDAASVLVVVTLYGGNDGLGTVIPAGDKAYQDARSDLAYSPDEVLPLSDGLGLNPSMKGCKKLWDDHELAIVRGVSYPKPDHSHFRSMAIWQTAAPDTASKTGWLGRWLDGAGHDPLHAIAIGEDLPPLLAGSNVAGATLSLRGISVPKRLTAGAAGLAEPASGETGLQLRGTTSLQDLLRVERQFGSVVNKPAGSADDPDSGDSDDSNGASAGGQSALGAQLDVVAACIRADAPTRAYSVSLGGFDTHAAEKGTQTRLLGELDTALTGFLGKVTGKKVVVAVYSEFGRRVAANANDGTDHGTSGPVLVMGEAVKGGFYGDEPSLTDLDDGDLKVTTDFRDVYATLLERVLGADPTPILGPHQGRTAFL